MSSISNPTMVAALFVEPNGVYYGLPSVDPWDKVRDARTYAGPYPVVAHPPCERWHQLSAVNLKEVLVNGASDITDAYPQTFGAAHSRALALMNATHKR